MLKILTAISLFLIIVINSNCQDFQFDIAEVVDLSNKEVNGETLNGLSSIQYINSSFLLASDRINKKNSSIFSLTSEISKLQQPNITLNELDSLEDFQVINNLESFQYLSPFKSFIYSIETLDYSFICISSDTILTFKNPVENRGVEGITISTDSTLWVSFETSKNIEGVVKDSIEFFGYSISDFENETLKPSKTSMYPYDYKSCFTDNSIIFDGNNGNGVSEILADPENKNIIYVLERCYYSEASMAESRVFQFNLISKTKTQVFDCGEDNLDNLEGMTWGDKEEGKKVIWLISDNNFNKPDEQKTLLIKIKEGESDETGKENRKREKEEVDKLSTASVDIDEILDSLTDSLEKLEKGKSKDYEEKINLIKQQISRIRQQSKQ